MLDSSSEGLCLEGLLGAILFIAAMVAVVWVGLIDEQIGCIEFEKYYQSCAAPSPGGSRFGTPRPALVDDLSYTRCFSLV